jgi:hypothetical protein
METFTHTPIKATIRPVEGAISATTTSILRQNFISGPFGRLIIPSASQEIIVKGILRVAYPKPTEPEDIPAPRGIEEPTVNDYDGKDETGRPDTNTDPQPDETVARYCLTGPAEEDDSDILDFEDPAVQQATLDELEIYAQMSEVPLGWDENPIGGHDAIQEETGGDPEENRY